MPNPYLGNDDAARFVDYYASPRMQKDSVYRLYERGIQQRLESQRRAEEEFYPPPPKIYRSQKEIDKYINRMVYGEVFRRQKKLAEMEWDLYKPAPTHYFSPEELEQHVRHMYNQQMPKKERRERDRQLRIGLIKIDGGKMVKHERGMLREHDMNEEQKENWRPPSAHIKYNDGQMLLVSDLGAIHAENTTGAAATGVSRERHRSADLKRLEILAKPLRVTQKVCREEDSMPPFRVQGGMLKVHKDW